MANISQEFKESNTSLGIFYPKHYVVAALRDTETLKEAERKVFGTGRSGDKVIVLSANEVLDFFDGLREETGTKGSVMRGVSRAMGDDVVFADADIERAKHGAGLIMIHSEFETEAKEIRDLLLPLEPLSMRWYEASGILSLV